MNEVLQNGSSNNADSLFSNTGATSAASTKQTVRLNVGTAEKALVRRTVPKRHGESEGESGIGGRMRRAPLERMLKIHNSIADKKFPNALELAEKFEVAHKTVCRDIEYMRDHYEFPIEFDRARGGYYYSKPVDGFPGVLSLTEQELFSVLVADKAVEQYRGTSFHGPLRKAFKKLTAQLDSSERYVLEDLGDALSFRPFAPEEADLQLIKLVTGARRERRVLEFTYRKPGEKEGTVRRVHPYHVMCCENRWYFLGLDEAREALRMFALGRMEKPTVCAERFTRPRHFDPMEHLRGSFNVMTGEGDYEVVIEFDAVATDHLRGRQWHSSQEITELPGGCSRMRMRLSGLEEVERWVLGWGTRANVIGPAELVEKIGATVRQLGSRYSVATGSDEHE